MCVCVFVKKTRAKSAGFNRGILQYNIESDGVTRTLRDRRDRQETRDGRFIIRGIYSCGIQEAGSRTSISYVKFYSKACVGIIDPKRFSIFIIIIIGFCFFPLSLAPSVFSLATLFYLQRRRVTVKVVIATALRH